MNDRLLWYAMFKDFALLNRCEEVVNLSLRSLVDRRIYMQVGADGDGLLSKLHKPFVVLSDQYQVSFEANRQGVAIRFKLLQAAVEREGDHGADVFEHQEYLQVSYLVVVLEGGQNGHGCFGVGIAVEAVTVNPGETRQRERVAVGAIAEWIVRSGCPGQWRLVGWLNDAVGARLVTSFLLYKQAHILVVHDLRYFYTDTIVAEIRVDAQTFAILVCLDLELTTRFQQLSVGFGHNAREYNIFLAQYFFQGDSNRAGNDCPIAINESIGRKLDFGALGARDGEAGSGIAAERLYGDSMRIPESFGAGI